MSAPRSMALGAGVVGGTTRGGGAWVFEGCAQEHGTGGVGEGERASCQCVDNPHARRTHGTGSKALRRRERTQPREGQLHLPPAAHAGDRQRTRRKPPHPPPPPTPHPPTHTHARTQQRHTLRAPPCESELHLPASAHARDRQRHRGRVEAHRGQACLDVCAALAGGRHLAQRGGRCRRGVRCGRGPGAERLDAAPSTACTHTPAPRPQDPLSASRPSCLPQDSLSRPRLSLDLKAHTWGSART